MDALTLHRKKRLQALIKAKPFDGNQLALANAVGLSESRISQMATEAEGKAYTFGERAASNLAAKLELDDRYFEEGFGERAQSQNVEEPAKPLISHSDENNTAASLLLRLTGILESLTQGQRGAAAELIAEAIKSPRLASSNAARLGAMVSGTAYEATAVRSQEEILRDLNRTRKPFPDDEFDAANKRNEGT